MHAPTYRRLTLENRCQIQAALEMKMSLTAIGKLVGKHKSSISREIRRNSSSSSSRNKTRRCPKRSSSSSTSYTSAAAHKMAHARRRHCHRPWRIQGDLEGLVIHLLLERWSPDQIACRASLELPAQSLSRQCIYDYIRYRDQALQVTLRRFNRRGAGRHRQRKRKCCKPAQSIHNRPLGAKNRSRFGHWERDCMQSAHQKQVLVCVERKSRFMRLKKIPLRRAAIVDQLTKEMISKNNKGKKAKALSVTNDNGSEFRPDNKLGIPVYFADPHKPQQRGTVENTIGLLRQYLPRSANLDDLTEQDIQDIEDSLNNRPRKSLGYRTPKEIFTGKNVALLY